MAKLSRNNIAYNLKESPFRATIPYSFGAIQFVFSSKLYKTNFLDRLNENRDAINTSLSNRFGVKINNPVLADLKLYSKIEKRGFLVNVNEVSVECLESITLDGSNLILKN